MDFRKQKISTEILRWYCRQDSVSFGRRQTTVFSATDLQMLYSCSKFYNSWSDLHILERCDKTEWNRSHWIQIYSGSGQQAIYPGNRQI